MKKRKIKTKKALFIALIVILIIILFLFIILNIILRKEIQLKNNDINTLEKIFPREHLENIKIYEKGLFSIGSTKAICKSIYFEDPYSDESISLLVHETVHTYQAKTLTRCIKMSVSSLYNQFIAFLKYGSRNFAYYYSIDKISYNPEQEAAIIEDYFYLKFLNRDISNIYCSDCQDYKKEEVIKNLETIVKKILKKYE